MSDLQNPEAKGTLMKPKFFITEQAIPIGTPDAVRRGRMAERWLAGPSNPWFAKALVNRLWSELVGRGFYDSVDDIGPDRECRAPRTLDMLAAAFESSGYDYRWLVQTIVSTKAYRTESVSRGDTEPYAGLVRSVAQPLRSDVLLDAMADVLQTDPAALGAAGGGRGMGAGPAMLRVGFSEQFGFDPSSDRDEVGSGVRETLALLNGNASRFNINANRPPLSTILQQQNAPVKIVDKLYLHTLCRLPDADERLTATRYLHDSPDGIPAATEDLFWVLLNSAEFRTRR